MRPVRWAVTALALGALGTGCGPVEVVDRDDRGQAILIRSPQPSAEDLRELKEAHGLRTVINLRGEHPDEGWFVEEGEAVEALGLRWEHIPVSGKERPDEAHIARFFELVEDREAWPILIHCQGGIHRTGLMTALYRRQYQRWSAQRAIDEMVERYFNWGLTNREALKAYLRDYEPQAARELPERRPPED